ncbi:hypothetical protein BC940DRAFT_300368 [Gongronella butleri]|nr:hypothetical protein BC940DRAFT_300368 [Gongronella butleri]
MNDIKSILKVNAAAPAAPSKAAGSSSWLSRLQSKLVSGADSGPVPLRRHDLKRVTFCVDHLTTEHPLDEQEPPNRIAVAAPPANDDTVSLLHCYERACRLREERAWSQFMRLLQSHCRFDPLTAIDLSNNAIGRMSIFGPIADTLVLDFGLKTLALSNCGLEDMAVRALLNSILIHDKVTDLDLSSNPFKTKGFQYIAIYIAESRALRSLNLSKTSPDRRAIQYVSRALSHTSLQHLNLDQCALKTHHLELLATGVRQSAALTSLSLRFNRLSAQLHLLLPNAYPDEALDAPWPDDNQDTTSKTTRDIDHDGGMPPLSLKNQGLQRLDLSGNPIHHQLGSFCQALYQCRSLQSLSLAQCQIYPHECALMADVLYTNQHLVSLDLSGNPLLAGSEEGIQALKTALLRNDTLEELNLADTGLDAEAAITLAEILPMNAVLNRLDLSDNTAISMAGLLALAVSIKMNSSLTFLDITIPANDRDMSDLQNDIVAVCTTNMIQRIEQQQQEQQQQQVPSSSTTSTSSNIPMDGTPTQDTLLAPNGKLTAETDHPSFPLDNVSLVE